MIPELTPIASTSTSVALNAQSSIGATDKDQLVVAAPVVIRGPRLRQFLEKLPVDNMEIQLLARQFFARCDLREKYMTLEKMAESFGISFVIAKGTTHYVTLLV